MLKASIWQIESKLSETRKSHSTLAHEVEQRRQELAERETWLAAYGAEIVDLEHGLQLLQNSEGIVKRAGAE